MPHKFKVQKHLLFMLFKLRNLTPQSAALYAGAICVQKWELATMHTNRHRVQRPLHWLVRCNPLIDQYITLPDCYYHHYFLDISDACQR